MNKHDIEGLLRAFKVRRERIVKAYTNNIITTYLHNEQGHQYLNGMSAIDFAKQVNHHTKEIEKLEAMLENFVD